MPDALEHAKLRAKLINAGRVLVDEGQGDYVWGHISARLPGGGHRFLINPYGMLYEEMTASSMLKIVATSRR